MQCRDLLQYQECRFTSIGDESKQLYKHSVGGWVDGLQQILREIEILDS